MIGQYYTDNAMQEWFLQKLPEAKALLKRYKSLDKIFDSFSMYDDVEYKTTKNAILLMCLPSVWGGIKPETEKSLENIDDAINSSNILSWNRKKLNHFKSHITHTDYTQSISVVIELLVALTLASRVGQQSVELYPELSNGKLSDIRVNLNGRSIFLEVGNLSQSLPEKKIQQILDTSTKYLGKKMKTTSYLQIEMDTAQLATDNKHIDVKKSVEKLNSEIDSLVLEKLVGFKGHFTINNLAYTIEHEAMLESVKDHLTVHDKELLDLIKSSEVMGWRREFDSRLLKSIDLITSIITVPSKTLLVETHTRGMYPSNAATMELESFLNHIVRHVDGQIKDGQVQNNEPNVLVVKGFSWLMFGEFDPARLHSKLKKYFAQTNTESLSGVAFFTNNVGSVIYINNDRAGENSSLSKEEIGQLGFYWYEPEAS